MKAKTKLDSIKEDAPAAENEIINNNVKPTISLVIGDSATLENDFFQKFGVVSFFKERTLRCSITNNYVFLVSDRRYIKNILNLNLNNLIIFYPNLIDVINKFILLLIKIGLILF